MAASQVTLCLSKSWIRAPMIGIPPREKGPFSAFFSANHPRLQTLRAPKPENRQKRRPIPPLWRIRRLRRTLPPAVQLSNRHGALHDVVERAFWGTGGQMGYPPDETRRAMPLRSGRGIVPSGHQVKFPASSCHLVLSPGLSPCPFTTSKARARQKIVTDRGQGELTFDP